MKWRNHRLTTSAIVFAATGHVLPFLFAAFGSVFPDAVEGHDYTSDRWKQNHRGVSHYLPMYLAICLLFATVLQGSVVRDWSMLLPNPFASIAVSGQEPTMLSWDFTFSFLSYGTFWFFVGAALHILEDAICGKVPIYSLHHKIGVRLFRVGTGREYAVSLLIVGIALGIREKMSIMDMIFFQGL